MGDELTLHESAGELGVHYMTVYRYVRLGLLRADKVKGTWRVSGSDLAAFRTSTSTAASRPAATSRPRPIVVTTGRRRAPWAERLESRLIAGDGQGSWGVVEAALASGADLDDICLAVMTPALRSIGARVAAGDTDVSVERRANGIAVRLVSRLGPRFTRRGRTRGVVVVGAPAGEHNQLPLAMLADILRSRGWEVFELGGDVPAAGFAQMVRVTEGVVAIGLGVTRPQYLESAAETIEQIRSTGPALQIVVGGEAVADQDHARSLGADHFVVDARHFAALLETIGTVPAPGRAIAGSS